MHHIKFIRLCVIMCKMCNTIGWKVYMQFKYINLKEMKNDRMIEDILKNVGKQTASGSH